MATLPSRHPLLTRMICWHQHCCTVYRWVVSIGLRWMLPMVALLLSLNILLCAFLYPWSPHQSYCSFSPFVDSMQTLSHHYINIRHHQYTSSHQAVDNSYHQYYPTLTLMMDWQQFYLCTRMTRMGNRFLLIVFRLFLPILQIVDTQSMWQDQS